MDKKGVFMPLLAVFTLIMFSWTYYVLAYETEKFHERSIGEKQIELYEIYMEGEKIIIYVDNAARMAAYDSILTLASNGGYDKEDISECGNVVGYNIWYLNGDRCYPDDIIDSFKKDFTTNFNKLLGAYGMNLWNDNSVPGLRGDFYDFLVDSGDKITINGDSREDYILGTKANGEEFKVLYKINPNFKQEIDYNFADYNELKIAINDAIRLCNNAVCFEQNVKKGNYDWKIADRDQYVLFEVNTGKKVFNQDVVVKFAVSKNA